MSRRLVVQRLGRIGYAEGVERQKALVQARIAGEIDDTLLFVDLARDAGLDQRLLALDALGVTDASEPLDDQPLHTAAGSKCSIRSLTSAMN